MKIEEEVLSDQNWEYQDSLKEETPVKTETLPYFSDLFHLCVIWPHLLPRLTMGDCMLPFWFFCLCPVPKITLEAR